MHPRNKYLNPVNYRELRDEYPYFAEKVQLDINGKLKINFQDIEAVRALTRACLHRDFNLNVHFPPNKLLPILGNRLNYILWIEDLLSFCEIKNSVCGIDIGAGASAIYCLLAVRMNPSWKMYGLEIDEENISYAAQNIRDNSLENEIILIDQQDSTKLFEKLFEREDKPYAFCMCNPPFYSNSDEIINPVNRGKRKRPLGNVVISQETVFEGGELYFVSKIFEESKQLRDKIEIYTSMFGCKKNFDQFLIQLRECQECDFVSTIFKQGKILRHAVAWSFSRKLSSFQDHTKAVSKRYKVLEYTMKTDNFKDACCLIKKLLHELEIEIKVIDEQADTSLKWELHALKNTWSGQRQKRRHNFTNHDEKRSKLTEFSKMGFEVCKVEGDHVAIKIFFIDGTMSKDCVNQILQFLRNKLTREVTH